jgi:hypothetical protein
MPKNAIAIPTTQPKVNMVPVGFMLKLVKRDRGLVSNDTSSVTGTASTLVAINYFLVRTAANKTNAPAITREPTLL